MARGKSNSTKVKNGKSKFKGFVNIEFTQTEIQEMLVWFDDRTIVLSDVMAGIVEEGFTVGFSWDDYRSVYQASLTAKRTRTDCDGWSFQFRHTDMHRLTYCLAYVVGEVWPNGGLRPPDETNSKYDW